MTYSSLSNSHLPRLSVEQIDRMAHFASSHAQDPIASSRLSDMSLLQRLAAFTGLRKPVFAGAGLVMASFACVALMVLAPNLPQPMSSSGQSSLATQQTASFDVNHSENTISEYIIQDFLDEMV